MFPESTLSLARLVLDKAREQGLHIVTVESCTGGLLSACLTAIPGASDVVDRGFVTYSNRAKSELLSVPAQLIAGHGGVSRAVARAMAEGACEHAPLGIAAAITGIAGPSGGSAEKPVGLVYIAVAREGFVGDEEHRFGEIGRDEIRMKSVEAALLLLRRAL
jgi:nicotinamide-nucleotide amidase